MQQIAPVPITWTTHLEALPTPIAERLRTVTGMREATRRAYNADLDSFTAWCAAEGASWLPATPDIVVAYLRAEIAGGWRFDAAGKPEPSKSVATVKRRAAAVSKLYRTAGLENPCDTELVRGALKDDADARGEDQKQAKGLTQSDADKIVGRFTGATRMRDVRDLALLLVGRDLLARANELVSLTVEAITWKDNGTAIVDVRRRKTSTRTASYPLGADAAGALKRWLAASGVASGPTFRSITKSGRVKDKSIGTRDVNRIVKAIAGKRFSSHSLRVGMAQDLVGENFELPAVMQAGGWLTAEMVARYTRHLDAEGGAVAQFHARRGKRQ